MRVFFYVAMLAVASLFFGCSAPTCDGRGPSEICEIHHTMMGTVLVKRTKTPPLTREYLEARAHLFIHSYPFALPEQCGSCVVYICDDCVRAEREWKRGHTDGK